MNIRSIFPRRKLTVADSFNLKYNIYCYTRRVHIWYYYTTTCILSVTIFVTTHCAAAAVLRGRSDENFFMVISEIYTLYTLTPLYCYAYYEKTVIFF